MRDDSQRLLDIQMALDRIIAKTSVGRAAFETDEMLQVWVLHHLQIIGEAARHLSDQFRKGHPDRVWSEAIGLRNILVHHYFEINPERIWRVIENDLGDLQTKVSRALSEQEGNTDIESH
ncbi:MAG: DUF86 domain-containing protein [Acidobacteriia bacterium]|nr:DUF86 domain-containing protein [Terriglobia bacterium]